MPDNSIGVSETDTRKVIDTATSFLESTALALEQSERLEENGEIELVTNERTTRTGARLTDRQERFIERVTETASIRSRAICVGICVEFARSNPDHLNEFLADYFTHAISNSFDTGEEVEEDRDTNETQEEEELDLDDDSEDEEEESLQEGNNDEIGGKNLDDDNVGDSEENEEEGWDEDIEEMETEEMFADYLEQKEDEPADTRSEWE